MGINIKTIRVSDNSTYAVLFEKYDEVYRSFDADQRRRFQTIETAIEATQNLGRLPLWDAYKNVPNYGRRPMGDSPKRTMNDVRTKARFCRFYAWLAYMIAPQAIVEIGAALGASGMYWLAGLETAKSGTLYSFEPNEIWHPIASKNFDLISDRHVLTLGTFENNISTIKAPAGIALIDAIHTRDFVMQQLDQLRSLTAPGAIVLFDDINFSEDMQACWADIAQMPDWSGVWQLGSRVGVIELPA